VRERLSSSKLAIIATESLPQLKAQARKFGEILKAMASNGERRKSAPRIAPATPCNSPTALRDCRLIPRSLPFAHGHQEILMEEEDRAAAREA